MLAYTTMRRGTLYNCSVKYFDYKFNLCLRYRFRRFQHILCANDGIRREIIHFRNANKQYRASLPGHDLFIPYPRVFSFIRRVSGPRRQFTYSHRRRRFIFPFHFAGANFGRRNFTDEYIRAQKIPSYGTTRSFVTNPRKVRTRARARLSSKNLHRGQF